MLLSDFSAWWGQMETIEQIYWIFAMPSSLIFVIMLILTFVGGDLDDSGDVDTDIEADHGIGFQFFTLKNLVGFFTVFAWVGLACIDSEMSIAMTIILSVASGILMMFIMASFWEYRFLVEYFFALLAHLLELLLVYL